MEPLRIFIESVVMIAFLLVFSAIIIPIFCLFRLIDKIGRWSRGYVDIKGQVIIVTGAAGGLGTAVVDILFKKGAIIYALDVLSEEAMMKKFAKYSDGGNFKDQIITGFISGGDVIPMRCDISKTEECEKFVERLREKGVKVYALLNNAGLSGDMCACVESSEKNTRYIYDVNFFAPATLTRELFHLMPHGPTSANKNAQSPRRGRIVTITSVGALVPSMGIGTYCSSKAALEIFFDCVRQECHGYIDSVMIEPHFTNTGIVQTVVRAEDDKLANSILADHFERARARVAKMMVNPGKTIMTPQFVGERIVAALIEVGPQDRYLVTPTAFVNGMCRFMHHMPNYFLLADKAKLWFSKMGLM